MLCRSWFRPRRDGGVPAVTRRPQFLQAPALHRAILAGRPALAQVLLDAGVAVDVRSCYHERTPLFHAASRSDGCAGILLAHGANPDARDHTGCTPLTEAARGDRRTSSGRWWRGAPICTRAT